MSPTPRTRRIFKLFFVWQEDAEAKWLSAKASHGWRLVSAAPGIYKFEKSEPEDVVFRFDFRSEPVAELEDYILLAGDAGWELVCRQAGWLYFRAPRALAEAADFFTDTTSRQAKLGRVAVFLAIAGFPVCFFALLLASGSLAAHWLATSPLRFVLLGIAALWAYAMVRILLRLRRLV